jgi:AAA15 family ATPase/GTPase
MNKIGFKNFRRFQNFNSLEYGGITFLVGRNNAGKSSLVKALLLIENYFKSKVIDRLSFGNTILDDANIVTFGRALNRKAKELGENYIIFECQFENYQIELIITGNDNDTSSRVLTFSVTDTDKDLTFFFDFQDNSITITKKSDSNLAIVDRNLEDELSSHINILEIELKNLELKKSSREYIELKSEIDNLIEKRNLLVNQHTSMNNGPNKQFDLTCDYTNLNSFDEIVDDALKQMMVAYQINFDKVQQGLEPLERFEDLRALKEFEPSTVASSFSHFTTLMNNLSIVYMGANPTKQSALFAIRDKNNALAQAIHEYKQLDIGIGELEHRFVLKWMKEFEVGDDFAISMYAGEAYEMKIISNNTEIHLADKGMGSIQAMLLIIRIACIIRKKRMGKKSPLNTQSTEGNEIKQDSLNSRLTNHTTVIIEEPELNLHPALQSKLADIFHDVNKDYQINFIIETHSEYLIRKTQLIVKDFEYEIKPNQNPFSVIYFDKDMSQWNMNYREDGKFINDFGTGFFDESSILTLNLL